MSRDPFFLIRRNCAPDAPFRFFANEDPDVYLGFFSNGLGEHSRPLVYSYNRRTEEAFLYLGDDFRLRVIDGQELPLLPWEQRWFEACWLASTNREWHEEDEDEVLWEDDPTPA